MLLPLATTLEELSLSGNKLGGTITDDIASFTKLKTLWLSQMGLKGTFAHYPRYTMKANRSFLTRSRGAQVGSQSRSAI